MPKTIKECIQTVEKQIELALIGLQTELDADRMYLEDDLSLEEKRDMVIRIREAADAIEDLYGQLYDMRAEARMMEEVSE